MRRHDHRSRRLVTAVAVCAGLAGLIGCGDDDPDTDRDPATEVEIDGDEVRDPDDVPGVGDDDALIGGDEDGTEMPTEGPGGDDDVESDLPEGSVPATPAPGAVP